jgi:cyclase
MLTKRIIPCLDVKEGKVVKGIHFRNLKVEGDPAKLAAIYEKQNADEIVFLDITASHERRGTLLRVVRKTADTVFIPFTVGGGIRNLRDIRNVLNAGADKVSINTTAVMKPELIKEASEAFGRQCIVVAIDAKRTYTQKDHSPKAVVENPRHSLRWEVYVEGGRVRTGIDASKWVRRVEALGAGEILLTSMDCDGTQSGYDIRLTRTVAEATNIPIIASGGAGCPEHILEVLTKGRADAALAASIFHRSQYSISEVKSFLRERGICVRI